jgi:hypothetical protein
MGIFLGDKPVSVYFNGTNASVPVQGVFLGGIQVFPAGTAAAPAALLLNFNGENESTTFTDSSVNGLTVTRTGTPEISTAQSKFGGASCAFFGDAGRLNITGGTDLTLGTGDFTIEVWIYRNNQNNHTVYEASPFASSGARTDAMIWLTWTGNTLALYANDGFVLEGSATVPTGEWVHLALVRSGGVVAQYINGVKDVDAPFTLNLAQGSHILGTTVDSSGAELDGFLDDLRVVKGKAVYTANFTPPAAQLGPDA